MGGGVGAQSVDVRYTRYLRLLAIASGVNVESD